MSAKHIKEALCAVLFVSSVLVSSAVHAQSLKSLRAQEAEESALAAEVDFTSEVCGVSISSSIDWSKSAGWPENKSLAEACDGALSAIEASCRSGSKPVTSFTCSGDGSGPSLSGTSLYYGASPDGDAYSDTLAILP